MSSNTKTGSASKIKMESFDDLFGGSSAQEIGAEQIINAPLADLHEFKDHPFKVLDDEKMEETTESIRLYGVLVPGIARPRAGGGYELIAGHRRKHGSERAGKTEMPIIIRNYSDDEATIIMVDSNIQRGLSGFQGCPMSFLKWWTVGNWVFHRAWTYPFCQRKHSSG